MQSKCQTPGISVDFFVVDLEDIPFDIGCFRTTKVDDGFSFDFVLELVCSEITAFDAMQLFFVPCALIRNI